MHGNKNRTWRKMVIRLRPALLGLLIIAGCAGPTPPFPDLPGLAVRTRFGVENLCSIGVSPRIVLGNVPSGTASYVVQISDTNVLIQTPWRETVPATSKTEIPEGAATTYEGPCLGDMTRFAPAVAMGYQHRVEVLAVDAHGKPLAYGAAVVNVESPYITARRQRVLEQQGGSLDTDALGRPNTLPVTRFPSGIGPINPMNPPVNAVNPGGSPYP